MKQEVWIRMQHNLYWEQEMELRAHTENKEFNSKVWRRAKITCPPQNGQNFTIGVLVLVAAADFDEQILFLTLYEIISDFSTMKLEKNSLQRGTKQCFQYISDVVVFNN